MPRINHEEYEILKGLDEEWKWIARDLNGSGFSDDLWIYKYKPERESNFWSTDGNRAFLVDNHLFQFIQWGDENPLSIAELIEGYEIGYKGSWEHAIEFSKESFGEIEETEVKKDIDWLNNEVEKRIKKIRTDEVSFVGSDFFDEGYIHGMKDVQAIANQLDEPEPKNIKLQDISHRLWELPLNNRKYWLEQLNDEFQEGYVVPLGLKTTDGEEQYLTYNGSYFASRRNKSLQQTFATLEEIPEFYRDLAERVL